MANRLESLPAKEQRGSRVRCVLFTDGTGEKVAQQLTAMVAPYAVVDPTRHVWPLRALPIQPKGSWATTHSFYQALSEKRFPTGGWPLDTLPRTPQTGT